MRLPIFLLFISFTSLSIIYFVLEIVHIYVEHALAYRINRDIYTPFAGDEGKSLHNQGNLTIEKFVITFIIKPGC